MQNFEYCVACCRKAIKEEDLEFHEELRHVYLCQFKQAMKNRLWNANKENGIVGSICKWFLIKQLQQKKEVKNSEKYEGHSVFNQDYPVGLGFFLFFDILPFKNTAK